MLSDLFLLAIDGTISGAEWSQSLANGDLPYLLVWVVVAFLLIPKGSGSKSKSSSPAKSGGGGSLVTYAIVAAVAYFAISSGALAGVIG